MLAPLCAYLDGPAARIRGQRLHRAGGGMGAAVHFDDGCAPLAEAAPLLPIDVGGADSHQQSPSVAADSHQQSSFVEEAGAAPSGGDEPSMAGYEMGIDMRMDYAVVWAYILGPFGAIGMLATEFENDLVRFHALQSLLLNLAALLVGLLYLAVASSMGGEGGTGLSTAATVLALVGLVGLFGVNAGLASVAYKKCPSLTVYQVPLIGDFAWRAIASE